MSTEARLITAEDLWHMPGDQRRELVRGELRTMAPAGFEHGAVIQLVVAAGHAREAAQAWRGRGRGDGMQ